MKLMIAKAVYYSSLTLMSVGLIAIVILAMYWLLSNPQAFQLFVSFLGLGLALFWVGLAYGWSEKYLEKAKSYQRKP